MSLGSKINEIRKQKGLSIDELCDLSGIPKGTLSKITAGITTSPTLDTVRAIASALECKLDDLDDNQSAKKSPDTAEAAPGEEDIKLMNYLKRGIYDMGFLPEGVDLTDRQLEALLGVCAILHAIFGE